MAAAFMTGCSTMNDPAFWAAVAQARQNSQQPDYSRPQIITPNAYGLGVNANPQARQNSPQPDYSQSQIITPNTYGPGVNSDQYGRPQTYYLQDGQQLSPIFQGGVQQNAYGPGVGMDQFGRPVTSGPP